MTPPAIRSSLITPGVWGLPVGLVSGAELRGPAKAARPGPVRQSYCPGGASVPSDAFAAPPYRVQERGEHQVRVLMTGGYGCIGSWVAKQLVERGQEVWIYDLKEDTHRLDLILDPEQRKLGSFRGGRRVRRRTVAIGRRAGRGHAHSPSGGLADPHLPGQSDPGREGQRDRNAGGVRGGPRIEGSSAAGGLCQLGGGARSCRKRACTRAVGDEVRLAPLTHYGAFKVCNELNARVYWLDHGITSIGLRPWTVYGVGRDFGMTSEPTKAIKSVALGRPYRISYGGKQDLQYVGDVAATFVRALTQPFEGADAFNLRGAGRADRGVRERALRRRPRRPGRWSRTATGNCRSHRTSMTTGFRADWDRSRAHPCCGNRRDLPPLRRPARSGAARRSDL